MSTREMRPPEEAQSESPAKVTTQRISRGADKPLSVPDVSGLDLLGAALEYAKAGWYVVPLREGTKNPGSILGQNWPKLSSRDPEVIVSWFAGVKVGTGVALHMGRSGALAFDVDHPNNLPLEIKLALLDAPYQQTRSNEAFRGHHLFRMPPGRRIGNGLGRLGKGWGDIRGLNGVIVVSPSHHPLALEGGQYEWSKTGSVPALPDELAELMDDAGDAQDAAPDPDVLKFLDTHTGRERPELLEIFCASFKEDVSEGASRHTSMLSKLTGAMKESACGYFPAKLAAEKLERIFMDAVAQEPKGKQGARRVGAIARNEWKGLLAWAVGQALMADLDKVRARVQTKVPADRRVAQSGVFQKAPPSEGLAEKQEPSWDPVKLNRYLDGSFKPVEPTLLTRTDGISLLYPGLVHSFHGESESGKSLLLQGLAAHQVSAGQNVLFIDFESDPGAVVGRLRAFGATSEDILEYFTYINPEVAPHAVAELEAWHAMFNSLYSLAVIDGVTDALGLFGYKTKENDDITKWMRDFPKSLATHTGAAVAIIDHVTKTVADRNRFAIGGQAKLSGLTGAAYTVEVTEVLGLGLRGAIGLRIAKDRPGSIRPHCGSFKKIDHTQEAARVVVDSTNPDRCVLTIEPPVTGTDAGLTPHQFRPTALMEKVSIEVEDTQDLSQNEILERVTGKAMTKVLAIRTLLEEGYLTQTTGSRNAHLHASTRRYRQSQDPGSDRYDPGSSQSHE
jgi:Bifunctional DNA primase/polymerase, N-terminal/AAA domain